MFGGKFIKNLKKTKLPKDYSASSIKDTNKYKYNLHLSTNAINESSSNKNNNNTNTIENNELKEGSKKLRSNRTNKNIFNISKTLTFFNTLNKAEDQDKNKDKDKDEINQTVINNNNQIARRINNRERLNNSRKKRAFFNNNNNNINNNINNNNDNINNNNNINNNIINNNDNDFNNNIEKEKEKNNLNNFKDEKIIKKDETKNIKNILTKKAFSKEKNRKKINEEIKENKELEKTNNEKEEDSFSIEKHIKEENLGNEIKDTVKCKMCLQKMIHPKMCPKCKNISCEKCLYNWFLKEQNKECNYCKEPINFYEFISVPFMDTIVDFVEKVIYDRKKYSSSFQNNYNFDNIKSEEEDIKNNSNNIKEKCDIHNNEIIYYYCLNCKKGYCKTCFVFFGNEKDKHVNHKIIEYSKYKKLNLPLLKMQEEKIENNINYINNLLKQCISFKSLYKNEQKTINEYISFILKEYNEKMDKIIKDIDNKIFELNQFIENNQKAKREIDDFYKKLTVKSRFSPNVQYFLDKYENLLNKKIEFNLHFNIPENINLKVYKSNEEEFDKDYKCINKKTIIADLFEMTFHNNKVNDDLSISLSIPKDNKIKHFYKAVIYYIIKESNLIYEYLLDDLKEGKNYYLMGKTIQLDEMDSSIFIIKSIIYDFYFE